jgi:hypothetical protein
MPNVVEQMQVVAQAAINPNMVAKQVALFHPDGTVLTLVTPDTAQTAATLLLTGYTIAVSAALPAATDTLNVGLGKLAKSIQVKQAAAQADFAGADITALKVELNAFLAKLRTATLVAP